MENMIPFALFGSGIAFGITMIILLIILLITDVKESGWMALLIIIAAIWINYMWGTFPVEKLWNIKLIGIYLLIGLMFSIIRTYFKGREVDKEDKKYFDLKGNVFRWWFLFPISAINWIFGKLLKDLYNLLYSKIGGFYEQIFNL